jgi:hypothetical protein
MPDLGLGDQKCVPFPQLRLQFINSSLTNILAG